jgi:hypothetical protein
MCVSDEAKSAHTKSGLCICISIIPRIAYFSTGRNSSKAASGCLQTARDKTIKRFCRFLLWFGAVLTGIVRKRAK